MEDKLKYWMNDDTGRVIAMEDSPGRLWSEIDFETYYALTHPGAKAVEHSVQPTLLESGQIEKSACTCAQCQLVGSPLPQSR